MTLKTLTSLSAGVVIGAVVLGGTAFAATGGTFVLGRSNAASSQTLLTNNGSGPVLALSTRSGQPPLAVSAQAGKASNLNADRVDGLDGTQLQRATNASCPDGFFLDAIKASGAISCYGLGFDFQEETVTTDAAGVAEIACAQGQLSLSGGFVLPAGTAAFANADDLFAEGEVEGYNVRLMRTDGQPYLGTVDVSVTCAAGGTPEDFGARTKTERPERARLSR